MTSEEWPPLTKPCEACDGKGHVPTVIPGQMFDPCDVCAVVYGRTHWDSEERLPNPGHVLTPFGEAILEFIDTYRPRK